MTRRITVPLTALLLLAASYLVGSAANFYYPVTAPIKVWYGADGRPLNNGYIYFGTANQNPVTNPITMYWDAAGLIPAAQPLRTLAGYITRQGTPANIYAPGDFSVLVTDSAGRLVSTLPTSTDIQLAQAVAGGSTAAAIPIADAGNYYTTDNVEAAFQQLGPLLTQIVTALAGATPVGARIGYVGTTAPTGWVLADGKTIGDVSSGGTERANADTVNLYTLLWNAYTDNTLYHIQDSAGSPTTRGLSASNDFNNHKRFPLPDYRGRVPATLDNLGGSTASRITVAGGNYDGTIMGNSGGAQNHTQLLAEMAAHSHAITDPGHTHTFTGIAHTHTTANTVNGTLNLGSPGASGVIYDNDIKTTTSSSTTAGGTNASANTGVTVNTTGSSTAFTVLQPTIIENTIIKL